MKIEQVNSGLVIFGLIFAALSAVSPSEGWFEGYFAFVDRSLQFFYVLLHVLGVAVLLKYLYSRSSN